MPQLKYYNTITGLWEPLIAGAQGATGPIGPPGPGVVAFSSQPIMKSAGNTTYYGMPGVVITSINQLVNPTANRIYYYPMFVTSNIQINEVTINVVSNVGAGNVRVGIYNADSSWQPTTLVMDSGNIDVTTNGYKTKTGLTSNLTPGIYLAALNGSVGPQLEHYTGGTSLGTPMSDIFRFLINPYVSNTYGNLPSTGTQWTDVQTNAGIGTFYPMLFKWTNI